MVKCLAFEERKDALPEQVVETEREQGDERHRNKHDHRIGEYLLTRRPRHLLQLRAHLAKEAHHALQAALALPLLLRSRQGAAAEAAAAAPALGLGDRSLPRAL